MKTPTQILIENDISEFIQSSMSNVLFRDSKEGSQLERVINAIKQAQKEAYNKAIDDACNNAKAENDEWFDHRCQEWKSADPIINKESILKLKK